MPVFRFDKGFAIARSVRAFLKNPENAAHSVLTDSRRQHEEGAEDPKDARRSIPEQRKRIRSKRRELSRIRSELQAARVPTEEIEHKKKWKRKVQQEIFQLESELRVAEERPEAALEGRKALWQGNEPETTGALPDFIIIGAQKCGTSSLYHHLTEHPLVEPAATKELHFFDKLFDEGAEWYRQCFPRPRLTDGQRTITGEATPYYLFHPRAAERTAKVVPQAKLIALLRNPVDRAYSHYQQQVTRRGYETLGFEEAIEAEEERLRGEREKMLEDEHYVSLNYIHFSYLTRGIYVDQLLHWSEYFPKEQLLVLKSEDFFEYPRDTLKSVLDFLGLPDWECEALEVRKKGGYQQKMNPATRKRLDAFFRPHNRRLYEHLGMDFGW